MTVIKNFSAGPSEWRPLGPFQETLLKDIKAIYSFISMKDALKDEAYQTEITIYNNWGISWLDRWALSKEKKGDFFKGDPVTPDYVKAFLDQR